VTVASSAAAAKRCLSRHGSSCYPLRMKTTAPKKFLLRPETLRVLVPLELVRAGAGWQNTPITPECPSEYPMCTPT
jgi:hypothetical protein